MREWQEVNLSEISTQRKGINYKSEDYCSYDSGYPFITIKCFVKGGGYQPKGIKFFGGSFSSQDALHPDDILFSVTDLTRAGDIVGSPLKVPNFGDGKFALASMDCMKITPISMHCDNSFLYHRMMLSDIRRQMVAYSAGSTVLHLDTKQVPKMKIRIPVEKAEQIRIAEILDTIDISIEKTVALIEKYQQIKTGLMHDLFTRGITVDGKLRPSREQAPELYEEAAIGWIPKEWEVISLRSCLTSNPTNGIYKPAELIGEGSLMVGQTAFTKDRTIDYSLCRRGIVSENEIKYYGLVKGDILITRVFATVEGVGLPTLVPDVPEAAVYESNMMRLRVNRDIIEPQLLFEWLRWTKARKYILSRANASNQVSVNQNVLNPLPVPLLDIDEQRYMVKEVQIADSRLDFEKKKLRKHVNMKIGLMQDLLTGKVSVSTDEERAHV